MLLQSTSTCIVLSSKVLAHARLHMLALAMRGICFCEFISHERVQCANLACASSSHEDCCLRISIHLLLLLALSPLMETSEMELCFCLAISIQFTCKQAVLQSHGVKWWDLFASDYLHSFLMRRCLLSTAKLSPRFHPIHLQADCVAVA